MNVRDYLRSPPPPDPPKTPTSMVVAMVVLGAFGLACVAAGVHLALADRALCIERTGLPCGATRVIEVRP